MVPRSRNPKDYPAWVSDRVSEMAKRYVDGDEKAVWKRLFDEVEVYHARPNSQARRIIDVGAKHFYDGNVLAFLLAGIERDLSQGRLVRVREGRLVRKDEVSKTPQRRSARLHLRFTPKSTRILSRNDTQSQE